MNKIGHKFWYYFLHSLVYLKRGLFATAKFIFRPLSPLINTLNEHIAFHLFKTFYKIKNFFGPANLPWVQKISDFLTRRTFFQIVLFVISILIIYPQSTFHQSKSANIPGQNTLLFRLAGPGDQDFSLSEIIVDTLTITKKDTLSWRSGAVSITSQSQPQTIVQTTEIGGIITGGGAVSKPSIMPGNTLPINTNTESGTGRSDLTNYTIQNGDTVGAIAERFNISVQTILWANGLTSRSLIRPGSILKILPVSGVLHKVARGETVQKISKIYNINATDIVKYNKLQKDGSDIRIGEELIIPNGAKPATASTYTPTIRKYTNLSNIAAPPPSVSVPAGTGYFWPAGVRRITQYYGWRHTGLDIAGPIGTPLYASRAGTVIKSQCGWNGGYGCYIIIDHGGGVTTLYGHASQLFVDVGEGVEQGQTIASMGSTGRSTGPHIHFEVRVNGARLNPLKYIR
ncbi:MAG TPA: M23 family metallopeptidase [Candidatus Magasanikbacteria bacterium]|nr:M23 family metallopeptidase [Candidatus Magasanikbacteria bacterium]